MEKKLKVLVVEDESFVAEYIQTLLESFFEVTVEIASSGNEALERIAMDKTDLILMDILLTGDMDGIETAEKIHALYDIPLIYLTAHDDEEFLQRAKITDPFGYMIKPIQPREFEAVVTIALQQYRNKALLSHDSYITKSLKKIYHPLIITDKFGKITSINEAASTLFSLSEENAITQSCETFLKVQIQDRRMNFTEEISKAARHEGFYKEEDGVILQLPSGGVIPISLTFSLVENNTKELDGVCIMIVDLTQQTIEKNQLHKKQLEAADLLISERQLKEILDIGKDISQALIHDTLIEERLNFAVNRIVQFSNFKIAHIALEFDGKLKTVASSRNSLLYINYHEEIPRSDPFLERLYKCFESGKVDLWEKREGNIPSLFNHRAEHIPIHSMLMLPLYNPKSNNPLGVMSIASSSEQTFDIDTINYFEEFANDIALATTLQRQRDEIEYLKLHRERNYEQTILSFVQMVEERDIYTRGHSERVAGYAKAIAQHMEYDEEACTQIYRAAILHDIGKIQTPDKILLKPEPLHITEYEIVKEHPDAAVRILRPIELYSDIIDIIAQHHERYDGKGYPKGLQKEDINPLARILSVADSFDAMTTSRIYRKRLNIADALKELTKESGMQFDPKVVSVAIEVLSLCTISNDENIIASEIERERMAYYFQDPLTHLYNEEYLQYYIQNFADRISKQYILLYRLSGLENYNQTKGWCAGNDAFKSVGKVFASLQSSLCFRIHGNRFLVLSNHLIDESLVELKLQPLLQSTGLSMIVQKYDAGILFDQTAQDQFKHIMYELIC